MLIGQLNEYANTNLYAATLIFTSQKKILNTF